MLSYTKNAKIISANKKESNIKEPSFPSSRGTFSKLDEISETHNGIYHVKNPTQESRLTSFIDYGKSPMFKYNKENNRNNNEQNNLSDSSF